MMVMVIEIILWVVVILALISESGHGESHAPSKEVTHVDAYSADFETLTTAPTRVWLWAICPVDDKDRMTYGDSVEGFIEELNKKKYNKSKVYFHNLAFDGTFLVSALLNDNRFTQLPSGSKLEPYTFNTLISRLGQWYQIKIRFQRNTVTIQDSLKKLPFSVKALSKAFDLPMTKGEIDYSLDRPEGYKATDEELDYISRDIGIVAEALKIQFSQGLTGMTIGADALSEFKTLNGHFRSVYPKLSEEVDTFCRKAYRGGYCYVNPKYQAIPLEMQGLVYDVNSMYPWAMHEKRLPYGTPVYFTGEYIENDDYPLYICHVLTNFRLKDGCLPTVQVKHDLRFPARQYVRDSQGFVELWLTSVDFELFLMNYHVYELQWIDGYMFRASDNAFKGYVDKWMKVKEENTGALRTLAKLMLNNLYGKFAKNPDTTGKHPEMVNGVIHLVQNPPETSDTNYIPVACFITAWARWNLIRSALVCGDRFCYCDTDSIHILGLEPVPGLEVHQTKLGAWKCELQFERAKYLHTKCYVEEYLEKDESLGTSVPRLKVTVSGLPLDAREGITFDNFKPGAEYSGKLLKKNVEGGVILVPATFKIKEFDIPEDHGKSVLEEEPI